jgi:hypothetical protein
MKDEALSPVAFKMEVLPIAVPTDDTRAAVETGVRHLIASTEEQNAVRMQLADWLRVEHDVSRPTLRLQTVLELTSDEFIAEVKKARGKRKSLTSSALQSLRDEYAQTIEPARAVGERMLALEEEVAESVYRAYGLTSDEIDLIHRTAPPRMPLSTDDSVSDEGWRSSGVVSSGS